LSCQAKALSDAGIDADALVLLHVDDADLIKRGCGRRLDPDTGDIYHVLYNPPPPGDIADRCIIRNDDTEVKMNARLALYAHNIGAIRNYFADRIVNVDGSGAPGVVATGVQTALQQCLHARAAERTRALRRQSRTGVAGGIALDRNQFGRWCDCSCDLRLLFCSLGGATTLVTFICVLFLCCSLGGARALVTVHLCSLHSAHANLTINQYAILQHILQPPHSQASPSPATRAMRTRASTRHNTPRCRR
jgi:hypothetical protein